MYTCASWWEYGKGWSALKLFYSSMKVQWVSELEGEVDYLVVLEKICTTVEGVVIFYIHDFFFFFFF